jgi:EmrB/QacA subfamily drug resistance transporter
MTQLIAFRAVQGLGGGGLTVTTQAVVGDLVPPRERGRYQGIFGAVFGLASIAGPLLGGFFTTHLSWRWIFYVNLPFGIAALVVLAATLPAQSLRRVHAIDYAGAALLAVALAALTLLSDVGGTAYPWSSPLVLGLIAVTVLSLIVFWIVERRATEPVLPPHLFGQRAFSVTSAVGLIVGFALFGSVTYFPLYLQVVKGVSPTASGLQMLPMMGGMLTTSIISGQLISKTGRYKFFPLAGTAVMTVALWLLSTLSTASSTLTASIYVLILGVGLGMVMQVLVIAVQNAVAYRDLGVATSGATLFRLIGGSLGTAILGAIFAARLAENLRSVPGANAAGAHGVSVAALAQMPPALRAAYGMAFTTALDRVFLIAAAVCAVGFMLAWLLPEHPLRATVAATAGSTGSESGEAFARPSDESAVEAELVGALAALADRDVTRQHIARIVARAGESLTPLAAWLLVRIERHRAEDPIRVARAHQIDEQRTRLALDELAQRDLIAPTAEPTTRHETAAYRLTQRGCAVLNRLVDARREHLAALAREWSTDGDGDMLAFLRATARQVVPEVREPEAA